MVSIFVTGLLIALALLGLLWVIQFFTKDPAVADVGWAASVVLISLFYFSAGDGLLLRKWLAAAMGVFWGLRLSLYVLLTRILGRQKDLRYKEAQEAWGRRSALNLFLWFMLQGVLGALFSLPILFPSMNGSANVSPLEWFALGLWVLSFIGEIVSDYQLQEFRKNPEHRGQVCRAGLWNYSRHPNYFFEVMIWFSAFLYAFSSPYGFFSIVAPVLVAFFIFRVSGIPMTEGHALRTKGDAYREYQRTTSMFVPWFPKK